MSKTLTKSLAYSTNGKKNLTKFSDSKTPKHKTRRMAGFVLHDKQRRTTNFSCPVPTRSRLFGVLRFLFFFLPLSPATTEGHVKTSAGQIGAAPESSLV